MNIDFDGVLRKIQEEKAALTERAVLAKRLRELLSKDNQREGRNFMLIN